MQMLSELETSVRGGAGVRPLAKAAGVKAARPAAPELPGSPKPPGTVPAARDSLHIISLTTAYGDIVAAEEVPDAELGAALHRIYDQAILRASAVVVLDGVTHTRNSFLEFVRAFNDWAARQRATRAGG